MESFPFPLKQLTNEDFLPVDVFLFKEYYKLNFLQIIDSFGKDNPKLIYIDNRSLKQISFLFNIKEFKERNLTAKILEELLNSKNDKIEENIIIFLIEPLKENVNKIIEYYFKIISLNPKLEIKIIFTPCQTYEIIEYMTLNDIKQYFDIYNYYIDLIPIDFDLLSFEQINSINEIYCENKLNSLTDLAKAIVKLEACFGKIVNKYIKGDYASLLNDLIKREENENDVNFKDAEEIFGIIILDRTIDNITPFCSNYTYEGLIDELFDINYNKIHIDENILNEEKKKDNKKKEENKKTYFLTSSENNFYCRIRSMHYNNANTYLKMRSNYFQEIEEKTRNLNTNDETEKMNKYMNELIKLNKEDKNYMSQNINIARYLNNYQNNLKKREFIEKEQLLLAGQLPAGLHEYYENYVGEKKNFYEILRLMLLESITQNGIKDYEKIKRDLLNVYGFQNIFLFRNLEKIGWLKDKDFVNSVKRIFDFNYRYVLEKLNLINDEFTFSKINDCSYLLSGFCPISLRLIEKIFNGGWNKINEILKKIPGQYSFPQNENMIFQNLNNKKQNIIFVTFIGGVTYTEIEGIRFLNLINENFKFIIITNCIINHKKLINSFEKKINNIVTMKGFYESSLDKTKK
jgi:hypothetical protein